MRLRLTAVALATVLSVGLNQPALATAIVDVQAFFAGSVRAEDGGALPAGFAIACLGAGCSDTVHVFLSRTAPGETTQTKSDSGGIAITNNTGTDSEVLIFLIWSAFNPGGLEIGASVDDPTLEFASFSSRVAITVPPNPLAGPLEDFHACETSVGEPSCGVKAPDANEVEFPVLLAAGSTVEVDYVIDVSGTVRIIPEPGTVALFGAGLMMLWRRAAGGRCRSFAASS